MTDGPRLRLTKIDELQFLTCFKHGVWGSKSARFKEWHVGDYLAVQVDKHIAGLAKVAGKPYQSQKVVWDNGLFPHRIDITFTHAFIADRRPPILGQIRDTLIGQWDSPYGWGVLNQQVITGDPASIILNEIIKCTNNIEILQDDLDNLLASARTNKNRKKDSSRPKTIPTPSTQEVVQQIKISDIIDTLETSSEESDHTRAQWGLAVLGRATGCLVWTATNDKGKSYQGKKLSDLCIKSLPNFGLNKEATGHISLIDTIWIKQSAPVCAFEIEMTTSVYSGLLRMSDLIALVPSLKIQLFIVSPKSREQKVMKELARPTFRKIGLNDYCKFIALEDLEVLIDKIHGLEGHIQPSVLDSISVELQSDPESGLD